ncbi:VWA domain-containing protein [Desulfococcaceae bacterium HSG7]|nr:VWA domain-containing protein [Desulfococcaceae bacterium HSG7]
MASKIKPVFWFVVFVVAASLIGLALYRAKGLVGVVKKEQAAQIVSQSSGTSTSGDKFIDIKMYSSSAKKNWINAMVKTFNASRVRVNDQTARVKVWHVTSGGSFDMLKAGKIKPDIWSPGDESWLQMAKAHWLNVKQKQLFEDFSPLVNIPLVVAVWEPMAKALGHPQPIGWRDLAKIAANPQGWSALGHPEWGKFRWGHAHPDANSGFLTVISEIYAVLEKAEGITLEDIKKPEVISFLRKFEGAVEHYGLSNSWIDKLMHTKGPSYLSAAVQYENTIIQTNAKHKNKPFKLTAIYPREGNFRTQHPAAILKEAWMTDDKESACKKFINFLLNPEAQRQAMEMGLRPILKDIEMSSPFDTEHGVKPNLASGKTFKVPPENVLKRIRNLWEEVKTPATIILVIDRSGSMKGSPMDNAKAGAIEFIRSMKPRDQLMLTVFNRNVNVLAELCAIRQCGENVTERLNNVFANGETALYDALAQTYKQLKHFKQQEPGRRYSILLLSDGKDTGSKLKRHDFIDLLPGGEDFDAPKIYTIAYGSKADRDLLAEISNRTNARLFISSPEEIRKTYKELSANF